MLRSLEAQYAKKHSNKDDCCSGNIWLRGGDLNPRPLGYEPNELPDCSTPRHVRKLNAIDALTPLMLPCRACTGNRAVISSTSVGHDEELLTRTDQSELVSRDGLDGRGNLAESPGLHRELCVFLA